ncbi:MAG: hypothetical protein V7638_2676 [Acidobacteriota bacterium]|jgi:hypothetical protein
MSNWRKIAKRSTVLFCALLTVAAVARSQTGQGRPDNSTLDDYDRTLNLIKNDAKAASARRRSLFPQINEDFQRIQVIHNEIVRMLQPDKGLNYDRLMDLTSDMKKRSARLRENLALPQAEKTAAPPNRSEAIDDAHLKKSIANLHDVIVNFVANPLFKNLGVVDAKVIDAAGENLDDIIGFSEEIKREAKLLTKKN